MTCLNSQHIQQEHRTPDPMMDTWTLSCTDPSSSACWRYDSTGPANQWHDHTMCICDTTAEVGTAFAKREHSQYDNVSKGHIGTVVHILRILHARLQTSSSSSHIGPIVGGVRGSLTIIASSVVVTVCIRRHRPKHAIQAPNSAVNAHDPPAPFPVPYGGYSDSQAISM
ncbi:uncharacterized protein BCR38DRAFT_106945 [Pseudomassariella vexata]|uniref:Uncharacterized protein n=1 Tax=Pseudomassariella vexata TaxID=1141098 RepID=A0A1Y2EFT1_9PEZI|nr:uncharacterized protein BCR38DRAFT_106945 [Pseudomassariella vexata]ORY70438.1 hypothetical protein BCR38DRAFT_106945 [Pseudomassariella vexata]